VEDIVGFGTDRREGRGVIDRHAALVQDEVVRGAGRARRVACLVAFDVGLGSRGRFEAKSLLGKSQPPRVVELRWSEVRWSEVGRLTAILRVWRRFWGFQGQGSRKGLLSTGDKGDGARDDERSGCDRSADRLVLGVEG
jgi:hypothetical protein